MKCLDAQRQLDDYLDKDLEQSQQQAVHHHLADCIQCQHLLKQESELRRALRTLPVQTASPGFDARLFSNLEPAKQNNPLRSYAAGFVSATIISVAIWVTAGIHNFSPIDAPTGAPQVASVYFDLDQAREVRLVFSVPETVKTANLRMVLPAGFGIDGLENERVLEWQTDLAKGENYLVLPIIARRTGSGDLLAVVTYGGAEKSFRVNLSAQNPDQLGMAFQLNSAT